MDSHGDADVKKRLLAYANDFLRGYAEAVDSYYTEISAELSGTVYATNLFPLYRRSVGGDTAVAAFLTPQDFYLFFLDRPDVGVLVWKESDAVSGSGFDESWTFNAPVSVRYRDVQIYLGIDDESIIPLAPHVHAAAIGGTNFMASSVEEMGQQGYQHGIGFGGQAGSRAAKLLPGIRRQMQEKDAKDTFVKRTLI